MNLFVLLGLGLLMYVGSTIAVFAHFGWLWGVLMVAMFVFAAYKIVTVAVGLLAALTPLMATGKLPI